MRLSTIAAIMAVPCVCAAAPLVVPEEAAGLISTVQAQKLKPPFARQEFKAGVADWMAGRYLSARNHWVRAGSWLVRTLPAESPAKESLAQLIALADRLSRPEPVASPVAAPRVVTRRQRRRVARPTEEASTPVDARTVMERARVAQKAGELEKAAQLMRIASQLPGGESAAAQAEAIERELVQPAR